MLEIRPLRTYLILSKFYNLRGLEFFIYKLGMVKRMLVSKEFVRRVIS